MSYLEELLPEFRKGAKIRFKKWKKDEYICIKDSKVVNEKGSYLKSFYFRYLKSDEWELYQEPIDWDYVIENKCLCLFWNDDDETAIGILKCKFTDGFLKNYGGIWNNCRPVRRDEVTFYEDKKDD